MPAGAGDDAHGLARFTMAQGPHWAQVQAELRAGRKRTHWMWFIFPQMAGLGFSAMSRRYGLTSLEEAAAYLGHPLLGARLAEATALVNTHEGLTPQEMFGAPDDLKFHSSMTLFAQLQDGAACRTALRLFFGGRQDEATIRLLAGQAPG